MLQRWAKSIVEDRPERSTQDSGCGSGVKNPLFAGEEFHF